MLFAWVNLVEGGFMLILELALAALLSTRGTAPKTPPPANRPIAMALPGTELANAIKTEIEALAGPGSVDVSIDHETLYSVRVAVSSSHSELSTPIFDRALELYKLFPDLSFDFYVRVKPTPGRPQGFPEGRQPPPPADKSAARK
jgi:hypothetical protein